MEPLIVALIGIVVLVIAGMIGRAIVVQWRAPLRQERATVVAKRSATSSSGGGGATPTRVSTTYYVTFELGSGERKEFWMRANEYGVLVERDEGTLTYKGSRYRSFERRSAPENRR